jgi:hypothetical protein
LKKIFPGVDTLAERKKFAIFHACTLVIAPIIAMLLMLFINWGSWLFWSLFVWNAADGDGNSPTDRLLGSFIIRFVHILLTLIFPLYYLYNLCYIFVKGDNNHV